MKPMTFTAANIPLLMADLKTMSRRIMRVQPGKRYPGDEYNVAHQAQDGSWIFWYPGESQGLTEFTLKHYKDGGIKSPHQPGDIVYVAEGYQIKFLIGGDTWLGHYLADGQVFEIKPTESEWIRFKKRKKPHDPTSGRFMYRSLARIDLEILAVKAERIKSISDADIKAEGIEGDILGQDIGMRHEDTHSASCYFMDLWNSIHGPDAWDRNDWVWAYTFKRVGKPQEE